jgi:hypothetical protein
VVLDAATALALLRRHLSPGEQRTVAEGLLEGLGAAGGRAGVGR